MIHAFHPDGERQLVGLLAEGPALLAFDFDGTLAPIRPLPGQAAAPAAARVALGRLGARHRTAVISGRALPDLQTRLGDAATWLLGNHGAEGATAPDGLATRCEAAVAAWRHALVDEGRLADLPGVFFEDKRISASLHYRHAPDPERAREVLQARAATLDPTPRLIAGKAVWNLLAPEAPDKGAALLHLRAQAGTTGTLFVGDDDTDEKVFALDLPGLVAVRVGYRADSAARLFVRGPAEVLALLRLLARLDLRRAAER